VQPPNEGTAIIHSCQYLSGIAKRSLSVYLHIPENRNLTAGRSSYPLEFRHREAGSASENSPTNVFATETNLETYLLAFKIRFHEKPLRPR
jgi:hypothetical protein